MKRRTDVAIAIALLTAAAIPLALGGLLLSGKLIIVGGVVLVAVARISYKLLRYPSTRCVPLGALVGKMRVDRSGSAAARGILVSFSGIDGSGKTTQAKQLVEEFRSMDVDAVHIWARWRPFVSYPLMGFLYFSLGWRRKDYSKSKMLGKVWGYFVFADQLLFFYRHVYPNLVRGRVVCVDRYVLDQLVEMRYDGLYSERAAQLLTGMLRTPDVSILMDVPSNIALNRKDDTQQMLDRLRIETDTQSYLTKRRQLFLGAAEKLDVMVVDSTRPLAETHNEITSRAFQSYFEF